MATQKIQPGFTEFDVHKEFWANLHSHLPRAKRIYRKSDGVNVPDGWVELDGMDVPVEIKRDAFGSSAVRQLRRYMTAYGATMGVAVGKFFHGIPDSSIIRIRCQPQCVLTC